MPTRDDYLADYEPLYAALGNVGSSIDAPSFYHRPSFGQDESVDPMAEVARASAAAEAQQLANPMQVAAPQSQAPQPPQMRQVRSPVDLLADARQQSADIGNRHRLGALIDAFVTGGKNRQTLTEQGRQQQADALRSGAQRQKREDLQVAQAKQRAQAEFKQAQAAEQKRAAGDPNSPQNRRYQDSLLKMFPQLQGKEDIVRTWTVEGHRRHKEMLSPLRKGAETSAAEEAKEAASAKFGKSRLDRAVELAKAKQEALLPGQIRRARAGATVVNTGRLAAEERAEQRKIAAEERQEKRRSAEKLEDRRLQYAKQLESSGILTQRQTVDNAMAAIKEAKEAGGGEIFGTKDELVRRGPDWIKGLASDEAQRVIEAVQTIQNMTLKDRSGAAVTDSEFDRLKVELGTAVTQGEAALERSLKRIDAFLKKREKNLQAGVGEKVVKAHKRELRKITEPTSDRVRVRHPNGKTGWIPAANLEKALAKGYEQIDG